MIKSSLFIEEDVLERSRNICRFINDSIIRNKAIANVLAAEIVKDCFEGYSVDVESSLHKSAVILNKREIADIYVNGAYIDVRLCFDDESMYVPREHFDNGLLPVVYMFVKIDNDLKNGEVLGFIEPSNIDMTVNYNGYFKVDESALCSIYDIESLLNADDRVLPASFSKDLFDFLDGSLENENEFFKLLFTSSEARFRLLATCNAVNVFNYVSIDSAMSKKQELEQNNESVEESDDLFNDEGSVLLEDNSDEHLDDISTDKLSGFETDILEVEEQIELIDEFNVDGSGNTEFLITSESLEELDSAKEEELTLIDDYNFSTEVTPSINSIEESFEEDIVANEILDDLPDEEEFQDDEVNDSNDILSEQVQEEIEQVKEISSDETEIVEPITVLDMNDTEQAELSEDVRSENQNNEVTEDVLEFDEDESEQMLVDEKEYNSEIITNDDINQYESNDNIEVLFNQEESQDSYNNDIEDNNELQKKKRNVAIPFVGTLVLASAIGYYAFSNLQSKVQPQPTNKKVVTTADVSKQAEEKNTPTKENENVAMPIETVENIKEIDNKEDAISVSIPAIENNLNASILVSNLSVNWEVPTEYTSNTATKRYFLKVGKIIQLNLKTELLLLSKPPITNKISLELNYNKVTNKFDINKIILSSGEKVVDDLIVQTVKKTLALPTGVNPAIFSNVSGNPILVIRL